jgi:predicted HNH restriction endonuclease
MSPNDEVLIGNIGRNVYIGRIADLALLSDSASEAALRRRARKAKGKPKTVQRTVYEFVRDPFVVAAALRRANGVCEVPGCTHSLFLRETGAPYLEVHHIVPLGEGGEDTILNVAAICPACHREHHFGTVQSKRRDALLEHVKKLEAKK